VPVAEPSGEYTATCSVDLSPAFGTIVSERKITITRPPADILDRRLEELRSEDENTRRAAAIDLSYFENDGERVFPALLECFKSAKGPLRSTALLSMGSYPEQIAAQSALFVKLLLDEKESESIHRSAAYYLAQYAPIDGNVQKALDKTKEAYKESRYSGTFEYYANLYKKRAKDADG